MIEENNRSKRGSGETIFKKKNQNNKATNKN